MDDNTIDRIAHAVAAVLSKAVTKKEADGEHPRSHYLVAASDTVSEWHLRVKNSAGDYDRTLCGAAWAALHGGYRGQKYQGPHKAEALAKLKRIYKSQGWDLPGSDDGVSKAETEPVRVLVRFDKAQPLARSHGVILGTVSSLSVDREQDAVADQFELEAAAIRFMERQALGKARATRTHGATIDGTWVASWPFDDGRWRAAFKPADRALCDAAARGDVVGFSIGGSAIREEV